MECNFQVDELAMIASALEFYRDHMARDVELTADNHNLALYFQQLADGADRILTLVQAQLGLPEELLKKETKTQGDVLPVGPYGEKIPVGERLCDFYPAPHEQE